MGIPTPAPTIATPAPTIPTPAPTIATPAPTIATPAPTIAPSTPAPTLSEEDPAGTHGLTCKATPGLKRGVSDASCAKCANGYKWWPCNDAILCECTGSSLVQQSVSRESRKRSSRARFLGTYSDN